MAVAFADDDATEALSRREVGRSAPTLREARRRVGRLIRCEQAVKKNTLVERRIRS